MTSLNLKRPPQRALLVVLGLYLSLGVLYSLVTPVYEASDEINHYPFVAHLAQGHGLPVQRPGEKTLWEQEGGQPPLYYALAAGLTFWIDTHDLPDTLYLNPHARRGLPLSPDNKNMVIHTPREDFPWRGAVLGVHLVRLLSLLLGAGTIVCTYRLAAVLMPGQAPLIVLATAVNAFLPMFIFISASVNNDNLSTLMASLTLLVLVSLVRHGAGWRRLLLLGVLVGLAALSKLGALGLLPLTLLALILRQLVEVSAIQRQQASIDGLALADHDAAPSVARRAARTLGQFAIVLTVAAIIAGWWYWRNWQLYGDPLGLNVFLDIVTRRPTTPTLRDLLAEFQGFRINFWGLFGAVNLLMRPAWIYSLLDGLSLLGGAGLLVWVYQQWRAHTRLHAARLQTVGESGWLARLWPLVSARAACWLLAGAWIVIVFIAVLRWTLLTLASQGRLLFPAIGPLCCFLALGLLGWLPQRLQRWGAWGLSGFMFLLAFSAPFTAIAPAYQRQTTLLTVADIPAAAQRLDITYGSVIRLLAVETPQQVRPGDTLTASLYWQALAPVEEDLSIYAQLLGAQRTVGQVDTYPGGGTFPTSVWPVGQVVRHTVSIEVRPDAPGPAPVWLAGGLYRLTTGDRLPAVNAQGQPIEPNLPIWAKLTVNPNRITFKPTYPLDANFDNRVRLLGYDLPTQQAQAGGQVPITLYWQVTGTFDKNYTVFIHLLHEQEPPVGQGDGPPLQGMYPTTAWLPGEVLDDDHRILLLNNASPSTYQVFAGFYDPLSGQRLPVLDSQGQIIADRVAVGQVEIVP